MNARFYFLAVFFKFFTRTLYVSQLFEYKPDAQGNLCWQAQFAHHADYKSDYPKGQVFTLPFALWKALISFYRDLRAGKLPLSFTLPPQGTPLSEPQCSEVYQRWLEYQVQHPLSNICYQVERAPKTKQPGKIGTNERFNPLHLQALGLGAGLALRAAQIYDPESYYQAPSPFAATSDLNLTAGPKLGQVNACSEQKFKRLLALNCPLPTTFECKYWPRPAHRRASALRHHERLSSRQGCCSGCNRPGD